jgi:hypothetical protein
VVTEPFTRSNHHGAWHGVVGWQVFTPSADRLVGRRGPGLQAVSANDWRLCGCGLPVAGCTGLTGHLTRCGVRGFPCSTGNTGNQVGLGGASPARLPYITCGTITDSGGGDDCLAGMSWIRSMVPVWLSAGQGWQDLNPRPTVLETAIHERSSPDRIQTLTHGKVEGPAWLGRSLVSGRRDSNSAGPDGWRRAVSR